MATVAAPALGTNSANQNAAQPVIGAVSAVIVPLGYTVIGAPTPTAVLQPGSNGYPIG